MFGVAHDGGLALDGIDRVDEVGGVVGALAGLADVAVLVLGATLGAGALDHAVGEEAAEALGVHLLRDAALEVAALFELEVDHGGQLAVLGRVGGVVEVVAHPEGAEVGRVGGVDFGDERLGGDAPLGGVELDGGAVGVVGAEVDDLVAFGTEVAHVGVGLDVLHHVAQMDGAVRVGERRGDEVARHVREPGGGVQNGPGGGVRR